MPILYTIHTHPTIKSYFICIFYTDNPSINLGQELRSSCKHCTAVTRRIIHLTCKRKKKQKVEDLSPRKTFMEGVIES